MFKNYNGPWAVISAEGLQLLVNMTEERARQLEADVNYPPAGDSPGICYAVPMHVAEMSHALWKEYEEGWEARKRAARRHRMTELLRCFD